VEVQDLLAILVLKNQLCLSNQHHIFQLKA
jgi:hypothetical protein